MQKSETKINNLSVKLLHFTPLSVGFTAIRTCYDSHDKSTEEKDIQLVKNIIKSGHESTIEHLSYNFFISGVSRALLQEHARHRIASLSVKSTRYTLKELESEEEFKQDDFKSASRYIVLTGVDAVDNASISALENLRKLVCERNSVGERLYPNDIAKFALPDSYCTEMTVTFNARSLRNYLKLRTSKRAMWEIRRLSFEIFEQIPDDHKFIFEDVINDELLI